MFVANRNGSFSLPRNVETSLICNQTLHLEGISAVVIRKLLHPQPLSEGFVRVRRKISKAYREGEREGGAAFQANESAGHYLSIGVGQSALSHISVGFFRAPVVLSSIWCGLFQAFRGKWKNGAMRKGGITDLISFGFLDIRSQRSVGEF